MQHACQDLRVEWLGGERSGLAHLEACHACAAWVRSTERQIGALSSLERRSVPEELDARLAVELAGDRTGRVRRLLESLVRPGAPVALDARVADQLRDIARPLDAESGSRKAQALRALDVQSVPDVLERLVAEELAAPERHRAERFSGSLPRVQAPEELQRLVRVDVRRRAFSRLVLGPALALTAACIAVWIAVGSDEPKRREYRFSVVRSASLDGIDPRALALAESLGGGPRILGEPR